VRVQIEVEKFKCSICGKESYNEIDFEICSICGEIICVNCSSGFDETICNKCNYKENS